MTHRKTRGVRYLFLQSLVVMLLNYPKTAFKNRKKSKSVKLNELINSSGVLLQAPSTRKTWKLLEQAQKRTVKMLRGLEHLCYEARLKELGVFSLAKRRL